METITARIRCPGCELCLPNHRHDPPDRFNASGECWQQYSDLSCYTAARQDPTFIHQHSGGTTRNITVTFGLIGLYLALERGYTGKHVQRPHMQIIQVRRNWPRLEPPVHPAGITVGDVFGAGTDAEKDAMIRQWMTAVWESRADRQGWMRGMTEEQLNREGSSHMSGRSGKTKQHR